MRGGPPAPERGLSTRSVSCSSVSRARRSFRWSLEDRFHRIPGAGGAAAVVSDSLLVPSGPSRWHLEPPPRASLESLRVSCMSRGVTQHGGQRLGTRGLEASCRDVPPEEPWKPREWWGQGQRAERCWRSSVGERRPTCDVLAQLIVLLTQRPQQLEDAVLLHQGQLVVRVVVDEVARGARGVALHLLVGMVEELHQPGHGLEAAGLRTGMWALAHVCARHRCA